jgi:hypothetical protein
MKGCVGVLSLAVLVLSGCGMGVVGGAPGSGGGTVAGGLVVQGKVHGGQQPVAGSKVSLWTVGTTGYGLSPVQLTSTFTDNSGNFALPAPSCAQASELTYLTAVGGSPGGTANPANAQISLIAAIGPCSGAAGTNVNVNEVTTVATVYALAKFMAYGLTNNSAPGVSVGYLAPSTVGITNAFATVNNLVNISTGQAYQYTPNGNGLVPQAEINTLANLLALCVNSSGGTTTDTACGALFAQVPSPEYPANTLQTALNFALQPANNPSGQWSLVTTNGPFQPTLASQPNDWALPVLYTSAGPGIEDLAIDASGNIWTANTGINGNGGGVSELTNLGVPFANSPYLSGNSGIDGIAIDLGGNAWVVNANTAHIVEVPPGGGSIFGPFSFQETSTPIGVAVDNNNNVWVVNSGSSSVTEMSNAGATSAAISPSGGYTGGNLSNPWDVAIDESGNAWVTNWGGNSLTKITPAGSLSNSTGSGLATPQGIAVDQSGNLWIDNSDSATVVEFNSSGSQSATVSPGGSFRTNGAYDAVDGASNIWVPDPPSTGLVEINSSGTVASPASGYQGPLQTITGSSTANLNTPQVAQIDQSGNVWVGDFSPIPISSNKNAYVTEFIGLGVPTVEPLAVAAQQGIIGLRPGSSPGTTLAVTSSSLPTGVQTAKYSYQLLASGGTGVGYTWSLTAGQSALSSVGLTLSSSGLLSGTLNGTVSGASIGFSVTDSAGNTALRTLSLTVTALTTLSITTTNLPAAVVGVNYNQSFAATGGSGSYTWSITSSTQQTALSNIGVYFSNAGSLNGTPTATTTGISFTVKVTDLATGQTATAPFTFIANNPVLSQCTHDGSGNGLLNGHYAFLLTGFDSSGNVLDQIGSFQANGTGSITNGLGDSNNSGNATAGEQSYTFSGTYSIGSTDKRGQMVISASNDTSTQYFCFAADTVVSGVATSGRVIDATGDGSIQTGVFQIQNTADFATAALNGGFAFGVQGVNAGTPLQRGGVVGQLTLNGSGGVSSGQVDIATYNSSSNSTSYQAAATLSSGGTYSLGSGGRGTLSISNGGGGATFIVYEFGNPFVSGFFMLSSANINTNTLLTGYAVQQMGASFTTAIAAGKGAFRKDGLDTSGTSGTGVDDAQIGQIGFDGSGNLSFIDDENDGGTITPTSGFATANYSVTPTGYLTITNAGSHTPSFYLYAPAAGFGLDGSNNVGLWVMVPQTGAGSFTASSLSGSYGIGTVNPLAYSSSGTGTSSGNAYPDIFAASGTFSSGSLALVQDEDQAPGTIPYVSTAQSNTIPWVFDSTYGASAGRFTIGGQVVGYIVSPTQAILMQNSSGQNPSVFIADHQ